MNFGDLVGIAFGLYLLYDYGEAVVNWRREFDLLEDELSS